MQAVSEKITDPLIQQLGIELSILRLDRIHPHIGGNKWFKLKYNLQEMKRLGNKKLLTFGGAYSNHIAAVAAAGKEFGFETIGVIRGEELTGENPILAFAKQCGMLLHFISRAQYRSKNEPGFIRQLTARFGDFYLLPEGGSNSLAVKGCSEILQGINTGFDFIICSVGTGSTLAGLIQALKPNQQAIGIPVLAEADFLEKDIEYLLQEKKINWTLIHDYHFGRYARTTRELRVFMDRFLKQTGIPLDPVYTGKMMYGIYDLALKGYFVNGEQILAVHTGGRMF